MMERSFARFAKNSLTVIETPMGDITMGSVDSAEWVLRVINYAHFQGRDDAQREMRKALGLTDKT